MFIEHHSPSSLNLYAADPSKWVLQYVLGVKQPANAKMNRGTAVESGVALGLFQQSSTPDDCINLALTKYDSLMAMSADDRRVKMRDGIPGMVTLALDELRPYGEPSHAQQKVEWWPCTSLKLPIIGYYDFYWEDRGLIVDLKTTEKMPSEIKISHARQVAFYAATMSDNMSASLSYVTPKKVQTYALENIREHSMAMYQIAKRVEKLLSLSDDRQFFIDLLAPNLESFYWDGPELRQLAYEHWRI